MAEKLPESIDELQAAMWSLGGDEAAMRRLLMSVAEVNEPLVREFIGRAQQRHNGEDAGTFERWKELMERGTAGLKRGEAREAAEVLEKAWALAQELGSPGLAPHYLVTLEALAIAYKKLGRAQDVLLTYERQSAAVLATYGASSVEYAENRVALAEAQAERHRFREATESLEQALELYRSIRGEASEEALDTLEALGDVHAKAGDPRRAAERLAEALRIRDRTDAEAEASSGAIIGLARAMEDLREFSSAADFYLRGASLWQADDPAGAGLLLKASCMNRLVGKVGLADEQRERALTALRREGAVRQDGYRDAMVLLSDVQHEEQDYRGAVETLLEVKRVLDGSEELEDGDYVIVLNNFATNLAILGDYSKAIEFARRVVEIRTDVYGKHHPETAVALNNLAGFHRESGDLVRALELQTRATAMLLETVGRGHPDYALSVHNLAEQRAKEGEFAKAEPLYEEALQAWREVGLSIPTTSPRCTI